MVGSRAGAKCRASSRVSGITVVLAAMLMVGCASRAVNHAPVEDRGTGASRPAPVAVDTSAPVARPLPGAENAGKPDYYTVKPGDTMIRIGLDTGQNWRDIVRWSGVENPNQIEVGQVLRIAPPQAGAVVATAPASSAAAGAVAKPVASSSVSPAPVPPVAPVAPVGSASAARPAATAASTAVVATPAPAAAPDRKSVV